MIKKNNNNYKNKTQEYNTYKNKNITIAMIITMRRMSNRRSIREKKPVIREQQNNNNNAFCTWMKPEGQRHKSE